MRASCDRGVFLEGCHREIGGAQEVVLRDVSCDMNHRRLREFDKTVPLIAKTKNPIHASPPLRF